MPSHRETCPRGCFRFSDLPIDAYYRRCGPKVQERLARGEPAFAYKKTGGPQRGRGGQFFYGDSIGMLLKVHGWGPGSRVGGKAAPHYYLKDNPCVFQLSREFAARMANRYERFKEAREAAKQRRAG